MPSNILYAIGAILACAAMAHAAHRSPDVRQRIAPFTALLDARYLPLLVAVVPQSFAVFDWLRKSSAPEPIAILGAVGYEAVYVGAIAWADYGGGDAKAQRRTAFSALAFSVAVAVYNYWPAQQWGALLHAGFPLVAFFYTLQMDTPAARPIAGPRIGAVRTAWRWAFGDPRPEDAPAPSHDTLAPLAPSVQVIAPPPHDAPALPEPSASARMDAPAYACRVCGAAVASASARMDAPAYACRVCGAAVASASAVASSARWGGCATCKPKKERK